MRNVEAQIHDGGSRREAGLAVRRAGQFDRSRDRTQARREQLAQAAARDDVAPAIACETKAACTLALIVPQAAGKRIDCARCQVQAGCHDLDGQTRLERVSRIHAYEPTRRGSQVPPAAAAAAWSNRITRGPRGAGPPLLVRSDHAASGGRRSLRSRRDVGERPYA